MRRPLSRPVDDGPLSHDIVLCALNARYQHTSFGLRCLRANLGALRERSCIVEFDLSVRASDVVERLLSHAPRVVGLGVYVWNATLMAEVLEVLKAVAPHVVVVLGGPEVSHELDAQPWTQLADAVIAGEGEVAFRELCERVLAGSAIETRVVRASPPPIDGLVLPYDEYTDEDVRQRVLYVEASRGCPYSCEFCLSALDEKVRAFPLEPFLASLQRLLERGATHFKFVDRTFNLSIANSTRIMEFFLANWRDGLLLHFEMVPDRFPEALREVVRRFPPGALQFEVGVQTLTPAVERHISRRQDHEKLEANVRFLVSAGVHVHADLIVGLPGETLEQFGAGFDALFALGPQEIQVGVLKRLRGAPISRHTAAFEMRYSPRPPYEVLHTSTLSFAQLQGLKRFAQLWDAIANSGNFRTTLALLISTRSSPFAAFWAFSEWFFAREGRTSSVSLLRQMEAVLAYGLERGLDGAALRDSLLSDYRAGGRHETPGFLSGRPADKAASEPQFGKRQRRHGPVA